jgi:methionyl-tRNA synthetase
MINISVKCPHCKKSLMDKKHLINKAPSIMVKLTYAGKNAPLYLSSIYGNYDIETDISVPNSKIAGFRCPHCGADLKSTRKCDICSAQMVAFDLKEGGQVQICSRRGCKKHILEFENPNKEIEAFYSSYLKEFNK